MQANYHTHTFRCRHASGTEREYIEAAIKNDIKVLGFSDHSPYLFPDGYYSDFRMLPSETEGYISVLNKLKIEYKNDIQILIGFEAEYYPDYFNPLLDFLSKFPYDYLLLGQHFLENEITGLYTGAETKSESRLKQYVEQTTEGLRTGKFLYFAHPDIFNFTGDPQIYRHYIKKLCLCAKELDIPLEINLLGLKEDRSYPRYDFFKIAAETGNKIVLGCDAHNPENVGEKNVLIKAGKFTGRLGINPEAILPVMSR